MSVQKMLSQLRSRSCQYVLLLTSAVSFLCFIHLLSSPEKEEINHRLIISNGTYWPPKLEDFEVPCKELLDFLTTDYILILILDTSFADKFNKKMNCTSADYPPKMAVPTTAAGQWGKNIVRYSNEPERNYYMIYDVDYRRAIYKFDYTTNEIWQEHRNALLPRNITQFQEHWRRSQIQGCLQNVREKHPVWDVRKILSDMNILVKYFTKYDMYLALGAGTLLGWYRECGFIPDTMDIDLFFRAEEYNPNAFAQIYETHRPFPILFDRGKHNLNKEYSFGPFPKIDLFEVVSSNGSSFISVLIGRASFRNVYPVEFTSNCAADLYGYMFWIPCEPIVFLEAEYGANWMIRDSKIDYTNTKNLVMIREHNSEEFKEFGMKYKQRRRRWKPELDNLKNSVA